MASATTTLKPSDYVHLHNHTHHSLLDGLQKIPAMISHAKDLGMEAIAITDHGTLSGAIEFYQASQGSGVKPIIGIETYVAPRKHTDKDPQHDKSRYHLIILAMNNKGYENLMRLSTIANLDGFYHKPRIDHELLEKYNEGLIVLSGCIGGEVGENIRYDNYEKAKEIATWYKSIFGDRYYIEIQDHSHQWDEQERVNEKLLQLARELDIKPVVTADAHYLTHDDQEAHEVLLCIQTGSFLSDEKRMSLKDTDLYVSSPEEIIERWSHMPEVITNTKEIADRCEITIDLGGILIPKFPVPEGETETTYLHKLVYQGLVWRYAGLSKEEAAKLNKEEAAKLLDKDVLERVEYELGVMNSMGFDGYFLIVADFINWGKDREIVFGPGRGSAAGSIVAYAMTITDLDPLAYDLLFERFLNPDRISMPDIDIDIQDNRRDEVIQYTVEKYGQDRVAHIVTYGTMAARNAIRDVARVLEVPYAAADRLAKMVPPPIQGRHIPLATSVKEDKDLKDEYASSAESKRVIDLAIKLEGTMRSHGVHAAGVVIAPEDIVKYTPLEMAQKGVVTTQYAMGPVEDLGLLKMDFLGLSNLTIIKNCLRIIKRVHGEDIDISALALDDPKTYQLLGKGDTTGVFQLESSGMKRYLRELKPEVFDDVIAMVALYRPGPLTAGLTQRFIDRKNGKEAVSFEHESMRSSLETTYGVLVYQEQVMRIAQEMSGFTGGQADTLRKAIGKKKRDVMMKMKADFVKGAIDKSGVSKKFVEGFWKDLEGFADYAFNKSHAACYGLIAYWTAYLKAHYPDAFMAAVMTSDYDNSDRLAIEIAECQRMGIEVLAPDVNESYVEFAIVPNKKQIRFGMAAVKNVGTAAVEEIIRCREADGPFETLEDFVKRVSTRIVNRKAWESLIKAGAFDAFGSRAKLLHNLETILAYGSKLQKDIASGQTDLFGMSEVKLESDLHLQEAPIEIQESELLQWERELLGLYISKHPLDGFEVFLNEQTNPITDIKQSKDKSIVRFGGVINIVREITTKKGKKMAFVQLEDKTSDIELIVFPDAYNDNPDVWVQDAIVFGKGAVNTRDRDGRQTDEVKILVDQAMLVTPEEVKAYKSTGAAVAAPTKRRSEDEQLPKLYLRLENANDTASLQSIQRILSADTVKGNNEVVLVVGQNGDRQAIKLPFSVRFDEALKSQLVEVVGAESVVFT